MYLIRKATLNDAVLLGNLGAQTFTDAYAAYNTKEDLEAYLSKSFSVAQLESELQNPNTAYYLCFDGDIAMGYLKLNLSEACEAFECNNAIELQRIYVTKEYYRKKAGNVLMQFALEQSIQNAFEYLWLGVWKENHRALAFYQSWGFETIGERSFKVGSKIYEDFYLRKKI